MIPHQHLLILQPSPRTTQTHNPPPTMHQWQKQLHLSQLLLLQNSPSQPTAQCIPPPCYPTYSLTSISKNTHTSLPPLLVYQRRNTNLSTPMNPQPSYPIPELELTPSLPHCPSPSTNAATRS
ncbi:hypothetical protein KY289_008110 [Solanum tuberosum]|nr:hypothetical protein KY289_008110 [Solanum tuberosum]